ncbi:MAG TPA: radical SAM protein [Patescibacteria group bacterium]|nr:radical SAM protein [Patescibacteria group bacterium]
MHEMENMCYNSAMENNPQGAPAPIRKPTFCCIGIAPACMLRCKMCFFWQNQYRKDPQEPTLYDWYDFIDQLADLHDRKIEINLAGGEPLSDKRNLALVRFGSKKGLFTSLNSNGFLINKGMAQALADSGLNLLVISLDSIDRNTHDFLRGVTGSYDRVMRAIDYFDKCPGHLQIWIQAIILERNLEHIIKLTEWVQAHRRIKRIVFQAVAQPFNTPLVDGWQHKKEYSALWPQDIAKVQEALDELIRFRRAGYKITNTVAQLETFKRYFQKPTEFIKAAGCNVDFYMNINHLGQVYMCTRKEPIGHIKQGHPHQIWYSETAARVRNQIRQCRLNCHHLINCCYEEE